MWLSGSLYKEADIAATRMVLTVREFTRLDVSIPLSSAGTALLVPLPDEESRLLAWQKYSFVIFVKAF